jgi:hypothetical protein
MRTFTSPNGFSASIEPNADGTWTISATPVPDHHDIEVCGSEEIAVAEVMVRCPAAIEAA